MKAIKKAQNGNKTKKNKKVPETPVLGDDLSISNAVRRLAKNPKDPENWVNQGLRLHPVIQASRAVSEAITRGAAALGNKRFKKENARTDSIYNAQKKELQKDKNGGKVVKKAKSGTTVAKAKDGKWMQKAAASIKRRGTEGKCTPITKPGCTGKAKTLAKTFKKIAKSNKKK
jgi:hypothetical protein